MRRTVDAEQWHQALCSVEWAKRNVQLAWPWQCHSQARSQGEFEGVPCSLAKFTFNETAAVQGSHHAAATRGSHIHVACRRVCDRDQEF